MLKNCICFFVAFVLASSVCFGQEPSVSARAAVVVETSSGSVVYSKNHSLKLPMASTTKIMTAICTIENINTNIPVVVSDAAVGTEGSSIYLKNGEVITVKELLYGLMLNSGNDAAVALAIAVSGSVEEFCVLMNKTAKNIGAQNTNFTNPSGLYDDDHYTTAYDMALITAYALKNPLFKQIVSTKEIKISGSDGKSRYLKNHNRLLWQYNGCIGVKTGYTRKCGRCLVTAAKRNGVTLVCVTLNAPDDWNDHKNMLDWGFSAICCNTLAAEGEYATSISVKGQLIPLGFDKKIMIPGVDVANIALEYKLSKNVSLPVFSGETLGRANFVYNGKTIASSDLTSLKTIPAMVKTNFWNTACKIIKAFIS